MWRYLGFPFMLSLELLIFIPQGQNCPRSKEDLWLLCCDLASLCFQCKAHHSLIHSLMSDTDSHGERGGLEQTLQEVSMNKVQWKSRTPLSISQVTYVLRHANYTERKWCIIRHFFFFKAKVHFAMNFVLSFRNLNVYQGKCNHTAWLYQMWSLGELFE